MHLGLQMETIAVQRLEERKSEIDISYHAIGIKTKYLRPKTQFW